MFETSKARTASLFVTLPTASTTKIMAALVVLEKADLDGEVTVSVDAGLQQCRPLLPGDTPRVREQLMDNLTSSGDDAA